METVPLLSVAVATAKTGTVGQLMVEGGGKAAITGGVLSPAVIVTLEDLEIQPAADFAVTE